MILETLILHGSDWIEWIDASGRQDGSGRVLSPLALDIRLFTAPGDLRLIHKPSGTVLLRDQPQALRQVVNGCAVAADLKPPMEPEYPMAGFVTDPAGHFLPRPFAFKAGNAIGHRVKLYRSALGTRYGRGGGIHGRLVLSDGTPASWGMVRLTVSPPLVPKSDFVAQADRHGEFCLALDRLPALTKDALALAYPAVLQVWAVPPDPTGSPPNPDELFPAKVQISTDGDGHPVFSHQLELTIAPGSIVSVPSPGHEPLVLQLP